MGSVLSPFLSKGSRGSTKPAQGSRGHLIWGKHQLPATNLSVKVYYCVIPVEVFIIHPGWDNHCMANLYIFSHRFPATPQNINFPLGTYFTPNTSHYMRTLMSAPLSDSARPGYYINYYAGEIEFLSIHYYLPPFIIHPGGEDHRQTLHRRFLSQQSTSLLISQQHQKIVKTRPSTYITSQCSHLFRRL